MNEQHHTDHGAPRQLPLAIPGEDPGRPVPASLHTDALRADLGPLACHVQVLAALPGGFVARLDRDTPRAAVEAIYAAFDRHAASPRPPEPAADAPAPKTKKPRPRKAAVAQSAPAEANPGPLTAA